MTEALHRATEAELADWDSRTVDRRDGHVFQSRAFGEFQRGLGWRTRYLVADDGAGLLSLERRWPWIGGGSAYLPRGPVPGGDAPERTAERLRAAADWLIGHGVDVVASDAEIPAASRYPGLLRAAGFRPIPEIQPSRHRLRIPLEDRTEADVFGGIAKSTRQRIRQAEKNGVAIVRFDGRANASGRASDQATSGDRATSEPQAAAEALDAFYDLLLATGERRGFTFGSRAEFVGWWRTALAAGHLVYFVARARASDAATVSDSMADIAGLILYRHGGRLSTVHSADRADARATNPGALHFLRWRAIQLAIAEGCHEMDLGGVDVDGARRVPLEGEAMFGLYEHKRSFGAEWQELTGAMELVAHPLRYRTGRLTARLNRELARRRPGARDDG
jgi:hypothetical protein